MESRLKIETRLKRISRARAYVFSKNFDENIAGSRARLDVRGCQMQFQAPRANASGCVWEVYNGLLAQYF